MSRINFDGVIEAVRYTPDGTISLVRIYQRRGAVWSDHVLLNRVELVTQLMDKKRIITGARKEFLGSVFKTGSLVRFTDGHILTAGQAASRDMLAGVSVF